MKKSIFKLFAVLTVFLMPLASVFAQEAGETEVETEYMLEIIGTLIAITSLVFVIQAAKESIGALKSVFNFYSVSFAMFSLALAFRGFVEAGFIEGEMGEFVFEVPLIFGFIISMIASYKAKKAYVELKK